MNDDLVAGCGASHLAVMGAPAWAGDLRFHSQGLSFIRKKCFVLVTCLIRSRVTKHTKTEKERRERSKNEIKSNDIEHHW